MDHVHLFKNEWMKATDKLPMNSTEITRFPIYNLRDEKSSTVGSLHPSSLRPSLVGEFRISGDAAPIAPNIDDSRLFG